MLPGLSYKESELEVSPAPSCPGELAGTPCVDGYWLVNSSLSLSQYGFTIEGRIRIEGDLNLTSEALLNWKGFAKSTDSYPELVPSVSSFVLAFVNVSGQATLDGNILVDITPENVDGIIGKVDLGSKKRNVKQDIFEADNAPSANLNISLVRSSQSCRKVQMSAGARTSSSGRTILSALFAIDDSECDKPKSNKLVKILVPIFVIVAVLLVLGIIVVVYKSPSLRQRFMPFAARKHGKRQQSITRYSSEQ